MHKGQVKYLDKKLASQKICNPSPVLSTEENDVYKMNMLRTRTSQNSLDQSNQTTIEFEEIGGGYFNAPVQQQIKYKSNYVINKAPITML